MRCAEGIAAARSYRLRRVAAVRVHRADAALEQRLAHRRRSARMAVKSREAMAPV
jgi:hypothetical protein